MGDSTLSVGIKLMERMESLQETWEAHHDESVMHLAVISNLLHQRSTTLVVSKEDNVPTSLEANHPDIVPHLIAKQTISIEESLIALHTLVGKMELVVGSGMSALRRDAIAKAGTAFKDRKGPEEEGLNPSNLNSPPLTVPVVVEMASWIDTMVTTYKQEILVLRNLVDGMDVSADGDIEAIRKRFGEQTFLDLGWEVEIKERTKALKALQKKQ
ncbi:hypothetical protein HDU97_005710 [Phlyctochytrium planicorne]|nr:hypothetical protein HDU97_005710 [Phlyctochytrium planicorne]